MIYDDEEKLFNASGKEDERTRDISPLRSLRAPRKTSLMLRAKDFSPRTPRKTNLMLRAKDFSPRTPRKN